MGSRANRQRWIHPLLVAALLALGAGQAVAQEEGEDEAAPATESTDTESTDTEPEATGEAADTEAEATDDADDAADTEADTASEEGADAEEPARRRNPRQIRALGDGIAVTTLSVGSLVTGIVLLVQSGNNSTLADGTDDPIRESELRDRSNREKAIGITFTSLGVVLAGVATWLWIDYAADRRAEARRAASEDVTFQIIPSIDPRGGGGVVIGGTF